MAFDPDAYLASLKPTGFEPSVPVNMTDTGIPGGPADMVSRTGGKPTALTRNDQDILDLQAQMRKGGNEAQIAAWREALRVLQSRTDGSGGAPFKESSQFDPDAYLASVKPAAAQPAPAAAKVPARPLTGPAAIPVEPGANTVPTLDPADSQSMLSKYVGLQKVIPTLVSGAVGGAVGPIAGLAHGLFGGKYGTPEGVRAADEFAGRVTNMLTYNPNNPTTEKIVGQVGKVMQNVVPIPIPLMEAVGRSAPAAVRAVGDATRSGVAPLVDIAAAPLQARAATKQAANVADSVKNASRIEAAQKMESLGLVGDPLVMNPTKGNKFKDYVAGSSKVQEAASARNLEQVPVLAKQEMGMPPETRLDVANTKVNAFDVARAAKAAPYDKVAKIGKLAPDAAVIDELSSLKVKPTFGGKAAATAANNVIDEAIQAVSAGTVDGAEAIRHIRQLRAEAQTILNSKKMGGMVTPEMEATAGVKKGIADAMETLVEANIKGDPNLLNEFRNARTEMAKIYAYENATDFNTGKMNPLEFAKATAKNPNLTGTIADLGHVVGQFPEVFGMPSHAGLAPARIARSSLGGVAGAVIGSAISPGLGTVAGGTVGAGVGQVAGAMMAKRMIKPGYQAKNAIPKDYRPRTNNLGTAADNVNALITD